MRNTWQKVSKTTNSRLTTTKSPKINPYDKKTKKKQNRLSTNNRLSQLWMNGCSMEDMWMMKRVAAAVTWSSEDEIWAIQKRSALHSLSISSDARTLWLVSSSCVLPAVLLDSFHRCQMLKCSCISWRFFLKRQ